MKRCAKMIVLFLLLGAIINVAVTWGCRVGLRTSYSQRALTQEEISWIQSHGERPAGMSSGVAMEDEALGVSNLRVLLFDSAFYELFKRKLREFEESEGGSFTYPASQYVVNKSSIGWPARSLSTEYWLHTKDWGRNVGRSSQRESKELVPMHPLWPGFAINTIFYAAILWLLFAFPFVIRRRRRIKRGLCPACAYPVGDSAVCSECGKNVNPAVRMAR